MSHWNTYFSRLRLNGTNKRDAMLRREQRFLNSKLPTSLSYHQAIINGEDRSLAIINSDDLNQKTLCTLPGEKLAHGGLVEWMDHYWLITELDANNELYSKGIMRCCNYQLRWVADDGKIVERWCIVEDGTKYMTGENGGNDYAYGDTRIAVTLPLDDCTIKLNRKNRFLIDNFDSPTVLAYELTKPFKLGGTYGQDGVVTYIMQECNTEDTDNFDLHIANYYKHFPRDVMSSNETTDVTEGADGESTETTGKRWF